MRREITACLADWEASAEVRAVVVRGAGSCFSAGFDTVELLSQDQAVRREVYDSSRIYHRAVMRFPKPILAAIDGYALAGGLDLAALCDVRLASPAAVFGHPEIKLGAPPLATPLRLIVGDGWARELCLTGRRIDADTALRIGLVTRIAPAEELDGAAEEVARQIAEAPAETLAAAKSFFLDGPGSTLEECFVREHDRPFEAMVGL
jgi:enoyl-CoA hydratase